MFFSFFHHITRGHRASPPTLRGGTGTAPPAPRTGGTWRGRVPPSPTHAPHRTVAHQRQRSTTVSIDRRRWRNKPRGRAGPRRAVDTAPRAPHPHPRPDEPTDTTPHATRAGPRTHTRHWRTHGAHHARWAPTNTTGARSPLGHPRGRCTSATAVLHSQRYTKNRSNPHARTQLQSASRAPPGRRAPPTRPRAPPPQPQQNCGRGGGAWGVGGLDWRAACDQRA